jgi:hypothetical protein
MSEHGWIELAALAVGGVCAALVLRAGREKGIGPQIRLALALTLIVPLLLILGMEKILSPESIATCVGALIGAGVPASGAIGNSSSK